MMIGPLYPVAECPSSSSSKNRTISPRALYSLMIWPLWSVAFPCISPLCARWPLELEALKRQRTTRPLRWHLGFSFWLTGRNGHGWINRFSINCHSRSLVYFWFHSKLTCSPNSESQLDRVVIHRTQKPHIPRRHLLRPSSADSQCQPQTTLSSTFAIIFCSTHASLLPTPHYYPRLITTHASLLPTPHYYPRLITTQSTTTSTVSFLTLGPVSANDLAPALPPRTWTICLFTLTSGCPNTGQLQWNTTHPNWQLLENPGPLISYVPKT